NTLRPSKDSLGPAAPSWSPFARLAVRVHGLIWPVAPRPQMLHEPSHPPRAVTKPAAKLATAECERLHKKRPSTAEQHPAVLERGQYRWGRLDPGGPSGLSAVVTFRADGSQPDVEIYFSTDILRPEQRFPKLVPPPSTSPPPPNLQKP